MYEEFVRKNNELEWNFVDTVWKYFYDDLKDFKMEPSTAGKQMT